MICIKNSKKKQRKFLTLRLDKKEQAPPPLDEEACVLPCGELWALDLNEHPQIVSTTIVRIAWIQVWSRTVRGCKRQTLRTSEARYLTGAYFLKRHPDSFLQVQGVEQIQLNRYPCRSLLIAELFHGLEELLVTFGRTKVPWPEIAQNQG